MKRGLSELLFLPYYYKLWKRRQIIEKQLENLCEEPDTDCLLKQASNIASTMVYNPTGYYCSACLESVFLNAAQQIEDVKCNPINNTVIHVLTQAYVTGGHSRVVERWIKLRSDIERHSVVVLAQGDVEFPDWLNSAVDASGGSVYFFNSGNIIDRARELRLLASKYERIILHTHMDDGTPIIAFGKESFTTPIIVYNHADHLFWLGVTIADIVADLKPSDFTNARRLTNGKYLGIPQIPSIERDYSNVNGKTYRKELGLKEDGFICVTTASAYKLNSAGIINFMSFIESLCNRLGVYCLLIGPSMNEAYWNDLSKRTNGHILPLGIISDKKLYEKYLLSSDLYLGSFPFMSFTATMDGVQCGLPFLQFRFLSTKVNTDIFPEKSELICLSEKDIMSKVKRMKHDPDYYSYLVKASKEWLTEVSSIDLWKERLNDLLSVCPKIHGIHKFVNIYGKDVFSDDQSVLNSFMYNHSAIEYSNVFIRKLAHLWMRFISLYKQLKGNH